MFEELLKTFEECREANWDGYGAQAVREETYHLAYQFLAALPLSTPLPFIGAEPDGQITVEWYRSPQRTLSVSISPEGQLHFAALLGSAKTCGTEPFTGAVPKVVADLIHRVTAA
ncbi:MAG: hypothetical protein ACREQW_15455 [Candidatus Binatia bacterium]